MAEVEGKHWWYKSLHELILKAIKKHSAIADPTIIDAGCGTGGCLKYLENRGYKSSSGLDVSAYSIEFCKSKNLKVQKSDLKDIGLLYKDKSADIIISCDTFYFFTKEEQAEILRKFHKILKQNGLVILNLPALKIFRGIHDKAVGIKDRFNKKIAKSIIDPNMFTINKMTYWPFSLSFLIYLTRLQQRIIMKFNPNYTVQSDISLPPKLLNGFLLLLIRLENIILKYKPFGSSIFVVLRKI